MEPLTGPGMLERLRIAGDRCTTLKAELTAEHELRNAAVVDAYMGGVKVDDIARAAGLSRTSVLRIVGEN